MSDCLPTRHGHVTVHELGDEAMVYDADGHTVNALTATAGRVLQRCDGRTAVADVARELHLHPGEVSQIVGELAGLGLVSGGAGDELSRRRLLQRGALVGGGIVVASIAVPMVAAQASGDTTPTPIAGQGEIPSYYSYYSQASVGRAYGQTVTLAVGTVITGFSFDHPANYNSPSSVTFNLWDPGVAVPYTDQTLGTPVVSVTQPATAAGTPLSVTFPNYEVSGDGPVTFTVVSDNNDGAVVLSNAYGVPGLTLVGVQQNGLANEYSEYSAVFTLYGHAGGMTHHALRAQAARTDAAPSVIAQQGATGEKPPAGAKPPGQLRGTRPGAKPGR